MHNKEELNRLSGKIIGLSMKVHNKLGQGFIEKIYEQALCYELSRSRIKFESQKGIEVYYEEVNLGLQRVDLLIDNKIIVELKSVTELSDIHTAQLISYLKTADKRLGLLINFATKKLQIKRIVNNF